MNVCLREYPMRLELRSVKSGSDVTLIEHPSTLDAWHFLKSQTNQEQALPRIRALLTSHGATSFAADDDLWREVARQLMAKSLYLVMLDNSAGGYAGAGANSAATYDAPPKRAAVSAPAPLPPPSKKPPTSDAPAPAPDATAALEQDVQAASLEQAAVNATPFCAVCEKAKAAARAQASQA